MTDDLAWDTVDSETVFSSPDFDVRRDEVRFPDGTEGEYQYVEEGESVVVLPFTPDGEVVVIEEWRQAVDRVSRGFPAGSLDPDDDDLAAAAHRELTEETGYVADEVEHLLAIEPSNGIADSVFHYFVAHDCMENGQRELDDDETIRVDLTTWERLRERARSGELRDGRTAMGVLYYDVVRSGNSGK